MAKDIKYEARVTSKSKDNLEVLDTEIKLLLLPTKTTKGERIEKGLEALKEKLEKKGNQR